MSSSRFPRPAARPRAADPRARCRPPTPPPGAAVNTTGNDQNDGHLDGPCCAGCTHFWNTAVFPDFSELFVVSYRQISLRGSYAAAINGISRGSPYSLLSGGTRGKARVLGISDRSGQNKGEARRGRNTIDRAILFHQRKNSPRDDSRKQLQDP